VAAARALLSSTGVLLQADAGLAAGTREIEVEVSDEAPGSKR